MAAVLAHSEREQSPGAPSGGGWRALLDLSVPEFAWEFLRRNPDYRANYARASAGEQALQDRWGLKFPADPRLPADRAGVFWRPEVAPGVVVPLQEARLRSARALPAQASKAVSRRDEDGLHLRLASGLQLLLRGEARPESPLVVMLAFDEDFGLRVRAVEALERLWKGRSETPSRLTAGQRARLARSLLALDGSLRHDSYRAIAEEIFDAPAPLSADFRTASVRDVTIRLVRSGRSLMSGGYLKLLKAGL